MSYFIDPETYRRYRDQVIALSQSIQVNYPEHLPPEKRRPGLSDEQIAEKLGIDVFTAREVRCVAEREYYGLDEWRYGEIARSLVAQTPLATINRTLSHPNITLSPHI